MYLCDVCDHAGFVERDDWRFARDTGLSEKEVDGAIKELTRRIQGAYKVLVRSIDGASEEENGDNREYIWLVNRIKMQSGSNDLARKDRYMLSCVKRLFEMKEIFPELEGAYKGDISSLYGAIKNKRKNNISTGDIQGGSVRGGALANESRKMTNDELRGKHVLYDKVLDTPGLRNALPYETFTELRKKWPDKDVDWPALIDFLCKAHVSDVNGITNAFRMITAMLTGGKFRQKGAPDPNLVPGAKEHKKAQDKITRDYEAGKIDAAECKKLIAANDKEYGVKG
jgi:hypothetical protein